MQLRKIKCRGHNFLTDNAAARLYGVESIPHILVVNKKGEIIAKDLRGEDLKSCIEDQQFCEN